MPKSKPRRAFTLIELLVVVGIIALLISILLPALSAAKSAAKGAQCLSNLRGIAVAQQTYCANNKGAMSSSLIPDLFPYLTAINNKDLYKPITCPGIYDYLADGVTLTEPNAYGWNSWAPAHTKTSDILDPSEVVMFADVIQTDQNGFYFSGSQGIEDPFFGNAITPQNSSPRLPNFHGRHGGVGSVLWMDGHASKIRPTVVPAKVTLSLNFGYCHKAPAWYNQNNIGYLTRSQTDVYSTGGLYYFVSRKEFLGANNILLYLDPVQGSPGLYQTKASLW